MDLKNHSGGPALALALAGVVACFTAPTLAPAQGFNDELLLSTGNGLASEAPTVGLDPIDNAFVVWEEDGELQVAAGVDLSAGGTPITASGLDHLHPRLHVGPSAMATVVFERDPAPGVALGEIFYVTNVGGPFGTPINLSQSIDPDSIPTIAGNPTTGERHVVWAKDVPSGSRFVYCSPIPAPPGEVTEGDAPTLAIHSSGDLLLAYQRTGDIYFRRDDGAGFGSEILVSQNPTPDENPAIAVDSSNVPHIVFSDGDDIQYARGDGNGGFLPLVNLSGSATAAANPQVLGDGAVIYVIYEDAGEIWLTSGVGGIFSAPGNITNSPGNEAAPSLVVDSLANIHVVYRRDGDIYYRNNSPVPVPSFEASPTAGELPLEVQFTDTSTGVVTNWFWEFGDGAVSGAQNPSHIYENTGSYAVTLTTTGPGATVSLTQPNLIQVISPSNVIRIPPVDIFQGQSGVYVPVLGTHTDPAQGYQLGFGWDCEVFDLVDVTLEFTEASALNPEFFSPNIVDDGPDCYFTMGLVFDTAPPFDGRTLDPGVDQRLLNLIIDVPFVTTPQETIIDLDNDFGDPPILNIFTVDGSSVIPVLEDGCLEVVEFVFPPPLLFIRGDVDQGGNPNLVDAIFLLTYLFQNGPQPPCLDAGDVNDDGLLGIADAISLLQFLFTGTGFPPFPYPTPGLDPTPDPLGDC